MSILGFARRLALDGIAATGQWLTQAKRRPPAHVTTPAQRALWWLRANCLASGGIRVHSRHRRAYPEVTGYTVGTLIDRAEYDLARRLVQWLIEIQRPDGSYPDPDEGNPHIFDTGQVLRGLLASSRLVPEAAQAAERAADYLLSQMIDEGRGGFHPQYTGSIIPETIQLYVLPPLLLAAEKFGRPDWKAAAETSLEYYINHPQFLNKNRLTHFLAYELEAMIDLDHADAARPVLDELENLQDEDGTVRAEGNADWVCVPGLAQLAVCWYKLGQTRPADRAIGWLQRHQRPSGGFLGGVGKKATYFPKTELSWAVKYFLDADYLRAGCDKQR